MGKTTFVLVGGVLAVGLGLLYYATTQGTSLVLTPSQLLELGPSGEKLRIRVAGKVAQQEIQYSLEPKIELRFFIKDPGAAAAMAAMSAASAGAPMPPMSPADAPASDENGRTIPVVYRKLKPDMFAAGRDVIIDGNFRNGTLEAVNLLTQCPSKYEPPKPTSVDYSKQAAQSPSPSSSGT